MRPPRPEPELDALERQARDELDARGSNWPRRELLVRVEAATADEHWSDADVVDVLAWHADAPSSLDARDLDHSAVRFARVRPAADADCAACAALAEAEAARWPAPDAAVRADPSYGHVSCGSLVFADLGLVLSAWTPASQHLTPDAARALAAALAAWADRADARRDPGAPRA